MDDELDELDPGLNDGSKEGGGSGSGKGKEANGDDEDRKEYRAGNCNDCNRQFCLDYNLPICKGAGMEDAFAVCFREFAPLLLRAGLMVLDGRVVVVLAWEGGAEGYGGLRWSGNGECSVLRGRACGSIWLTWGCRKGFEEG